MRGLPGALLLAFARTLPIAWLAPGLGAVGGLSVRLLVGGALAALALPSAGAAAASLDAAGLAPLVAREVAVGVALGLVAAVPFRAAEAAGALVDGARAPRPAASLAASERDGTLRRAFAALALAVFAAVGGPARWAEALAGSYVAVPLAASPSAAGGLRVVLAAGGALVGWGVALAAPLLVALLVAELVIGMVERALPTVRADAGAIPRQLAALAAFAVTAAALVAALGEATRTSVAGAFVDAARALAP